MEAALGWIGAIVEWFGRFLPRWDLVRANEKAVKYLPGGRTKVIHPGICWYWPASTELVVHPVCRQVLNGQGQTLMTKDGKSVFVCGLVIYEIEDVYKFLVENWDAEANLDEVLQSAIRRAVISRDFAALQTGHADVDHALSREARKSLKAFGVKVEAARLTEFSLARVVNVVGSGLTSVSLSGPVSPQ